MKLDLIRACENRDLNQVRNLVKGGADLEVKNENGQTPLFIAVMANDVEMAIYLMNKGANINARENTMLTPWLYAGAHGFHQILKEALKYNPDVKSTNRFGGTVLLPSAERGYLRTVEVCLSAGVPVNHVNDLGWSVLQEAVILGNGGYLYRDILNRLMDAGADVHLKDKENKTVLDYAKERGQKKVVAILEGKDPEASIEIMKIWRLIRHENYTLAKKLLHKALTEDEDNLELYYLLGETLMREESYEEALKVCHHGTRLLGGSPEFLFYTANALRRLKRSDEALMEYEKAVTMAPKESFYRYHRSNYLRELGNHEKAIEEMDILLESHPTRCDYLFHKANSLRTLGRHEEASQAMDRAMEVDPMNSLYISHKAQSKHLQGEDEEARALRHNALAMKNNPENQVGKIKVEDDFVKA